MHMKIISVIVAAGVCLLAGCGTNRPSEGAGGSAQKIGKSDDFKIKAAVYGYLLQHQAWVGSNYSAIFLEGSDAEVAALMWKFPNQVPPIKPGDRAQLLPHQTPLDKDTGKPALVLSAKALDPSNGASEAIGTWYGGEAVSGLCAFVLVKAHGEWTIQSVR